MAYIYSDISTFSGRAMLTELIGRELSSGGGLTVADEIISLYLLSLRVAEQYPNRVQTVVRPKAVPEILRGLFTNLPV